MKALFIGRFQPFHKGHLEVIRNASEEYEEVTIGIGSSQYSNNLDNPFNSKERKLMIEKSLEKINVKNYRIVFIPDIHNPPKWVDHVLSIIPDFDVVISNSSSTMHLFLEKGFSVKETPLYNKKEYSGKVIRRRIIEGKPWKNLIPQEVFNIIKDINGENRIKELSKFRC